MSVIVAMSSTTGTMGNGCTMNALSGYKRVDGMMLVKCDGMPAVGRETGQQTGRQAEKTLGGQEPMGIASHGIRLRQKFLQFSLDPGMFTP